MLISWQKMEQEMVVSSGDVKVRTREVAETPASETSKEPAASGQLAKQPKPTSAQTFTPTPTVTPKPQSTPITSKLINGTGLPLALPDGFKIGNFNQSSLGPVRFMAFSPDNILFVTMPSTKGLYGGKGGGKVYALPDNNKDGKTDEVKTILSGLNDLPHGIAFYSSYLYIVSEDKVTRYPYLGNAGIGAGEVIVNDLPAGGDDSHLSRTIGFSPSGKMYISVGSSCNTCAESDSRRAAILEYNPDGTGYRVFATGLRNTVGFVFQPTTGEIWGTDNGRDYLGDNLPPDEINIIREGKNYGWPKCYGKKMTDPAFNDATFCETTTSSLYDIQAHSATIGLRFINSPQLPSAWQGDLFVAYRGSWNRTVPTGYKIVRMNVSGNSIIGEEDFITGWLASNGDKLGRPVDVIFGPAGELYISDDKTGIIYIVSKL